MINLISIELRKNLYPKRNSMFNRNSKARNHKLVTDNSERAVDLAREFNVNQKIIYNQSQSLLG